MNNKTLKELKDICKQNPEKYKGYSKFNKCKLINFIITRNNKEINDNPEINSNSVILTGEDRTYGGNELFVDLIPKTCWFTNVRSCVATTDWDRLRNHIYSRVNNKCECCNSDENIEAHERWDYDDKKLIQKLVRLVALCKKCHEATHMGLARVIGKGEKAKLHLKNVRQFTDKQCIKHIDNAFNKWRKRSEKNWDLDLSLLTSNGIKLQKKVNKKERKTISENKINKKVRISRACYFCQKSDVGTTCETSAFWCKNCGFRDMHNDCYEMNAMQCPMCKKQNVFYILWNKNKRNNTNTE
jgi:hypothetical protein